MSSYNIFVVKDTHSSPEGRNIVRSILAGERDKKPDFFFVEWARKIEPGKIVQSFEGIAKEDAAPTLIDLARLAITSGIPVVSCDLSPDLVLKKLDEGSPNYAPHKESSLFQPYGMTPRDDHAAKVIEETMKTISGKEVIGLLMFGSAHFDSMAEHEITLDAKIRKRGMDVYFLKS